MKGETYDKERFSVNLARLKKGNEKFEVVINSDAAIDFKQGKISDIRAALVNEKIFSDAKKGMHASEKLMQSFFKTTDSLKVAEIIIQQGEIQLTEEYRERKKKEKVKRLIEIIHRNGIDPKTHLPHPVTRIEAAFEEAKVHIDDYRSAEDQLQDVLKKLRVILPIKFEIKEISIKIPADYAAKSYSTVKQFGKILRENWQSDGSWLAIVEMAGGLEQDFYDRINKLTHGNVEAKVLREK